jgi:hypothetical protein
VAKTVSHLPCTALQVAVETRRTYDAAPTSKKNEPAFNANDALPIQAILGFSIVISSCSAG